ncbi:MAG: tetratricopeptide repeat protein [Candidatus Omnitrophica bacterium]|nr:tetratricopeptide repeat protein [Candidatus Omnitrophota bacterium]
MKRIVISFMIIAVWLSGASFALAQAEDTPQKKPEVSQDQDVEVLLKTMNEVLEENRRIKDQSKSHEDAMQKMARENDLLRSQARRMKKELEDAGGRDKALARELEVKTQELSKRAEELMQENKKLGELRDHYEKRIPELEAEGERMKKMLDSAILEEERSEYLKLIESAQEMADRSFEELKAVKKQLLTLNDASGEAYYKLGNMLFDMKDMENAAASYRKALEVNPDDPWVHHNLGIIYDYYIHNDKQAIYHYRQYLRAQDPGAEANKIRERILDLQLKKNMIPSEPLQKDFFEAYTKEPR